MAEPDVCGDNFDLSYIFKQDDILAIFIVGGLVAEPDVRGYNFDNS